MFLRILFSLFSILSVTFSSCYSLETEQQNPNEASVRKASEAYKKAYNQHDAQALSNLWSEDATYVNPETGESVEGRQAIQNEFSELFKEGNAQIDIKIDSVSFPSDDKAIETGSVVVKKEGEEPFETAYKVFYVKKNGEWLIEQVREVELAVAPSQHEFLKGLDWLIGTWKDSDQDVEVITENQWDKHQNFITQKFTMKTEGIEQLEGRQIIGWDPIKNEIRSWLFDSDGGFGEGVWKKQDKSWVVEAVHTLADGSKATAINIYTPVNENSFTWQSTGREVAGEILPDMDPVTVQRVKEEAKP